MSFPFSSKYREAANIINQISVEKLPHKSKRDIADDAFVFGRIYMFVHDACQGERLFSHEEEIKLQSLFSFTDEDLQLVLNSCCYTFEQVLLTDCFIFDCLI